MSVKRIWHGWTTRENARAYQDLLQSYVFPSIEAKRVKGYRSIELLRKPAGDEVEFVTVMTFDDIDSVKAFVGDDYETVYVPERRVPFSSASIRNRNTTIMSKQETIE